MSSPGLRSIQRSSQQENETTRTTPVFYCWQTSFIIWSHLSPTGASQAMQLSIEAHIGTPPAADWKRPPPRVVHGEIGCSKWKTLAYLLVLSGSRARIVRCGGRYNTQLVKRSSEWVSEWGANGEFFNFCILAVFERYQQRVDGSTLNFIGVGTMSSDVSPPPVGSISPWGRGRGGGVKNSKNGGVVSFVHRTATISIFLSDAKCGSVCRAQTCAHSVVEPSRSA